MIQGRIVFDESNDDILLEDFDFEIIEEDVSLSAAPCEVSVIQMNLKPRSLVSSPIVEKVETIV